MWLQVLIYVRKLRFHSHFDSQWEVSGNAVYKEGNVIDTTFIALVSLIHLPTYL